MLLLLIFQAVQSAIRTLRIERSLSRLSDEQLAARGLNRSQILARAFDLAG
jgi:uncharacterized protein YjiS (DUF1127 family)